MGAHLMVPIQLDALVLSAEEAVVEATADFTLLPSRSATRDVNSDTANVSEDIVSSPFQNQDLYLKPGVYLHWALPDILTRTSSAHQSKTKSSNPAHCQKMRKRKTRAK